MVVATIPIKSAVFLFSLILFSCQNQINISENELINGQDIQKYIRSNEFTGTISVIYNNDSNLKSKRQYKKGKKNGQHEGWWPNGQKKYSFIFKNDMSEGEHFQWHQNGTLFTHKKFKNGLEDGEQKAWDTKGDLMYKYIYNNGVNLILILVNIM